MASANLAMRDALLARLYEAMTRDRDIFFLTADFGSPVIDRISADFSERFLNVGIAEQNLINMAAGLALEGFKVFAYAIAPFITMRCYEQIRVNLAMMSSLRPMNVSLIGVGAGYSYTVSGPTHQCYEDISIMRTLPDLAVYSPSDARLATALLEPCLADPGIKYLRLDAQVLPDLHPEGAGMNLERGFFELAKGQGLCVVATGYMVHVARQALAKLAEEGIELGLIELFGLSRLDEAGLAALLQDYPWVLSLEEGFIGRGGMDALLLNLIARRGLACRMLNCGIEGGYRFELGSREELHEAAGIGSQALAERIRVLLGQGV